MACGFIFALGANWPRRPRYVPPANGDRDEGASQGGTAPPPRPAAPAPRLGRRPAVCTATSQIGVCGGRWLEFTRPSDTVAAKTAYNAGNMVMPSTTSGLRAAGRPAAVYRALLGRALGRQAERRHQGLTSDGLFDAVDREKIQAELTSSYARRRPSKGGSAQPGEESARCDQ